MSEQFAIEGNDGWRVIVIKNPDDGSSQFGARVVHGQGLKTVLRAMFVDEDEAVKYVTDFADLRRRLAEVEAERDEHHLERQKLARQALSDLDLIERLAQKAKDTQDRLDAATGLYEITFAEKQAAEKRVEELEAKLTRIRYYAGKPSASSGSLALTIMDILNDALVKEQE